MHIVSLDRNGRIVSGMSVAADIDEKGLPMENKWKPNGYPQGTCLDTFREKYIRLNYGENRNVGTWEMAEIYRRFLIKSHKGNKPSTLGMYTGFYHLSSREPNKKGETPTYLWVFDAKLEIFTKFIIEFNHLKISKIPMCVYERGAILYLGCWSIHCIRTSRWDRTQESFPGGWPFLGVKSSACGRKGHQVCAS